MAVFIQEKMPSYENKNIHKAWGLISEMVLTWVNTLSKIYVNNSTEVGRNRPLKIKFFLEKQNISNLFHEVSIILTKPDMSIQKIKL